MVRRKRGGERPSGTFARSARRCSGGGTRIRTQQNPRLFKPAAHTDFPWAPDLTCRPEYLHPFASAIDEPDLKAPEEMVRSENKYFCLKERD